MAYFQAYCEEPGFKHPVRTGDVAVARDFYAGCSTNNPKKTCGWWGEEGKAPTASFGPCAPGMVPFPLVPNVGLQPVPPVAKGTARKQFTLTQLPSLAAWYVAQQSTGVKVAMGVGAVGAAYLLYKAVR